LGEEIYAENLSGAEGRGGLNMVPHTVPRYNTNSYIMSKDLNEVCVILIFMLER
jgi:hypothetical protein